MHELSGRHRATCHRRPTSTTSAASTVTAAPDIVVVADRDPTAAIDVKGVELPHVQNVGGIRVRSRTQ